MLLVTACACCVLTGIAIGTFVATMARSATQAQLMLFFVNPPLMALSGGFTPIEAMPKWIQPFTYTNPEPFAYVQQPITVDTIDASQAVLSAGPAAGTQVVTVGAAELLGVEVSQFEE